MSLHMKFREQCLAQSNRSTCEQLCWIRCSFDLLTNMCRHWVTGGVRGGRGQTSRKDRHALWQVKYAAEKETEKEVLIVGWLSAQSCLSATQGQCLYLGPSSVTRRGEFQMMSTSQMRDWLLHREVDSYSVMRLQKAKLQMNLQPFAVG